MSKITLVNVANLEDENTAVSQMAANNAAIATALTNTFSLDGTTPNSLGSVMDMNSNQLINLPAPSTGQSPMRLQDYQKLQGGGNILVSNSFGIEYIINGGNAQISTGLQGFIIIPFACALSQITLIADQNGSVVLDIWKSTFAAYSPPTTPTVLNTITASTPPTISGGTSYIDSVLTGWNKQININDVLVYNINSLTNITRLAICLSVTKQ